MTDTTTNTNTPVDSPTVWGPLRRLALKGGAAEIGSVHGLAYSREIREYAADRVALSATDTNFDRDQILALAEDCLPAHKAYNADLYLEMETIAAATDLSVAEVMIVGGYTDFTDYVRAKAGTGPVEHNCTAVVVPDGRTTDGGFVAQTWDMNSSATPRVVVLDIVPDGRPYATVFTTFGCLGQIGMNQHGIAIGINTLIVGDGKPGVTWPFVVRSVLEQHNFEDALACIVDAPVCGAHSYMLLAPDGKGAIIEKTPTTHDVQTLGDDVLVHTNHCLAPHTVAVEADRPALLAESSRKRYASATTELASGTIDEERLMKLTANEDAICYGPISPYNIETCGAVIMRPYTRDIWAAWGQPSVNPFQRL